MNAPLMWIALPMFVAGVLALLSERPVWMRWLSFGSAFLFAASAIWVPIGRSFPLGPWTVEVSPQLIFFGRRFLIENIDRSLVVLFYLLLAFWYLLSHLHAAPMKFYSLGMVSVSLVLTGYAVEPVFYAAIFFGFLAMVSVILLSPAGSLPSKGVLRFLAYQVLGMICILFAAWLLSWVDLDAMGSALLYRTMVLMGLGFSFLLGIFPFTSWVSMISEENHPFLVAFVFTIYLNGVLLFGLKYLSQSSWLLEAVNIRKSIQLVGLLMIGIGGLSAIFVSHLGRMLGAGAVTELGRSLVAFSLLAEGAGIFFALLVVQGVSFGIWSVALATFHQHTEDLSYSRVRGLAGRYPLRSLGMFCGFFAVAGMPLLGGFPLHWFLGMRLIESPFWPLWPYFLGNIGLLIGGIRMLSVLSDRDGEISSADLRLTPETGLLLFCSVLLLLSGIFPHFLLRWVTPLAAAF